MALVGGCFFLFLSIFLLYKNCIWKEHRWTFLRKKKKLRRKKWTVKALSRINKPENEREKLWEEKGNHSSRWSNWTNVLLWFFFFLLFFSLLICYFCLNFETNWLLFCVVCCCFFFFCWIISVFFSFFFHWFYFDFLQVIFQ